MSNPIDDANKMVSDTPSTDSCLTAILDADGYVDQRNCPKLWVSHSRELERELNAANAKIKRLEEAGDAMEKYCRDYYASNQWLKAKEDKP